MSTLANHPASLYVRPTTLSDALELLSSETVDVLAGGTDLVIMRSEGAADRRLLMDVKGIERLIGVSSGPQALSIGACTRLDDLLGEAALTPNALLDGAALVGGWQTRTRATLGGNVCRASPAGDTLCGLLVLRAAVELVSSAGRRDVAAPDFFLGPGHTARKPDELVTRLRLPALGGGSAYVRFTYRNAMDLAVAGVAARLELRDGHCVDAAIALGACGPVPTLVPAAADLLVGSTAQGEVLDDVCREVVAAAQPIDDVRGSRAHRLQVLAPLTRRAVLLARERAIEADRERP
jgi:carbon-monoxide dehydrogenase medium subunit